MKAIIENPLLRRIIVVEFESMEELEGEVRLKHARVLETFGGLLEGTKANQTVAERIIEGMKK
ncbi:MAG: hypothetical protein VCC01_14800 [Candidatus Hydrogenedentota bacterium]